MNNIKHVLGNLLLTSTFIQEEDLKKQITLCHQVNCKGVMGSGLALSIKQIYPEVYEQYRIAVLECLTDSLLGQCQICTTYDFNQFVANLFGQDEYGTDTRKTNYEALYNSLVTLKELVPTNSVVAFPKNLGSQLAGGNWNIILTMITEVFKDTDISVYIVEYVP